MKEQFCTYEIASKLKELGFDEPCLAFYDEQYDDFLTELSILGGPKGCKNSDKWLINPTNFAAPLWQQVIDFLWNKYHIIITRNPESVYNFNSWIIKGDINTYTLDEVILKAIELCKKN